MAELVIVGIGGFGREALSVALAMRAHGALPYASIAALDDHPTSDNLDRLAAMGVPFAGSIDDYPRDADSHFVVGIGAPKARVAIARRLYAAGHLAGTLVHPAAVIAPTSRFGAGSVVCAGVQVSVNVVVGDHVHLNPSATIGHDVAIHDFVSVNPGAILSGDVTVHAGSLIGAGAVVLQGRRVGEAAIVGASACVVRDVDPGSTVKGVPAR